MYSQVFGGAGAAGFSLMVFGNSGPEYQRECSLKPRVARNELGWDITALELSRWSHREGTGRNKVFIFAQISAERRGRVRGSLPSAADPRLRTAPANGCEPGAVRVEPGRILVVIGKAIPGGA